MAGRRDRLAGCDRTVAESSGNIGNRQVADTIATIRNDNASLVHQSVVVISSLKRCYGAELRCRDSHERIGSCRLSGAVHNTSRDCLPSLRYGRSVA